MLPTNNLDKFTVRHVGGIVQIAINAIALSPADARELARRINLVAAQARDFDLDVDKALAGL